MSQLNLVLNKGVGKERPHISTRRTLCKSTKFTCHSRPERIVSIAKRFDLDPEEVLSNIICARAHTVDSLSTLLNQVAAMMLEDAYSILIVDSIMAPFRVDYSGRGELADRQ